MPRDAGGEGLLKHDLGLGGRMAAEPAAEQEPVGAAVAKQPHASGDPPTHGPVWPAARQHGGSQNDDHIRRCVGRLLGPVPRTQNESLLRLIPSRIRHDPEVARRPDAHVSIIGLRRTRECPYLTSCLLMK